jgi:hypothetical protein
MKYSGKEFSNTDVTKIREIIEQNPLWSRFRLSKEICKEFDWIKIDGTLKDMSCRVAMLRMQTDGLITLPAPKTRNGNGHPYKRRNTFEVPSSIFSTPVHLLKNIRVDTVKTKEESYIWNDYIDSYHYLGHKTLPGAQLRYFIKSETQIIALLGFGAAAWKISARDKYIGWSTEQRERNLHLIVNNARLLVLPWVKCKNLISFSWAKLIKRLPTDWEEKYGYQPILFETFVDDTKYLGTCYKASNWQYLGKTQGRGKLDRYNKYAVPIKSIWVYPLTSNFKKNLLS